MMLEFFLFRTFARITRDERRCTRGHDTDVTAEDDMKTMLCSNLVQVRAIRAY